MGADFLLLLVLLIVTAIERSRLAASLTALAIGIVSVHLVTILQWPDIWVPAYAFLTIVLSWAFMTTLVVGLAWRALARAPASRR